MSSEFEPGRNETECPSDWRVKNTLTASLVYERIMQAFAEHSPLLDALLIALSFHVLMFPVIWFMGWALPWPKAPAMTTVIELNLENWPEVATPTHIEHLYEVEMSKARRK